MRRKKRKPSKGVQVSMSAEELKRLQETDRTLEIIRRADKVRMGLALLRKRGLLIVL